MIDYAATFTNFSGAFPDTEAINVSAPGAGDGTEFVAALVNDIWGRAQALMDYAGLTPDGVQEAPDTAQIMSAIGHGFGIGPGVGVIYWKNDTPAVWGDRVLLLQGQVILIASYPLLVAATYCGNALNPTAPAFYKVQNDGVTRDTAGTKFVLPDARGLSLKNIGNATVNTRTKTGPVSLGEEQEDQGQEHLHNIVEKAGSSGAIGLLRNVTASNDYPSGVPTGVPLVSGAHGAPRSGDNFRDSCLGTNYGITY